MFLTLLACVQPSASSGSGVDSGEDVERGPSPEWDASAAAIACVPGADAPLFDDALANASLAREDFSYPANLWATLAQKTGVNLEDPFLLSWFVDTHHNPEHAPCFAGQIQADVDLAGVSAHPVASLISAYAPRVDWPLVLAPVDARDTSFVEALTTLVEVADGGDDPSAVDASALPTGLDTALVAVIIAMADAISTRHAVDDAIVDTYKARKIFRGAAGFLMGGSAVPDITSSAEREVFADWFLGDAGPRLLADQARRIAFAVEDAQLSAFAGMEGEWTFATDAGAIVVSGSANDAHDEAEDILLLVDLGGDDSYTGSAGATAQDENPVSVLVDLGGDDTYGYVVVPDANDVDGALPSDADGRQVNSGHYTSASDTGRQGSGRYGIGLLFDAGVGADTYASLRMSQGFGAFGVGVLADDGGDDAYAAEAAAQGAGVFGIGILFDAGGSDAYRSWAFTQGFGYVGGGGLLHDAGGDDTYWADPGTNFGGTTLYYSPQLPGGEGNSSFGQGAGFGLRGDSYGVWWSGGLGMLRDGGGADTYATGVFGQGTGYWQGTGILADLDGNDRYNALYYVQGGAAHYAMAMLLDGGGNDAYNQDFNSYYMQTGAGHDFSVGVFIDESGDDTYGYGGLAAGASNCQGIGVFIDNDGSDTYNVRNAYSTGLGNHSGECVSRTAWASIGIFMDAGGDSDVYVWPDDSRTPADNSAFGIAWNRTEDDPADDEHGGAVDGGTESGMHAKY